MCGIAGVYFHPNQDLLEKNCAADLDGRFAFANPLGDSLFLVRDPLSIEPQPVMVERQEHSALAIRGTRHDGTAELCMVGGVAS